jgi:hypothetical protein
MLSVIMVSVVMVNVVAPTKQYLILSTLKYHLYLYCATPGAKVSTVWATFAGGFADDKAANNANVNEPLNVTKTSVFLGLFCFVNIL